MAALMLIGVFGLRAQMPQLTPLPLDPNVKHGVLPNGLTYYILHNEEPKNRANFYIAQKVGSSLETQEQLGLAHFLEHMAFNGTKNYPGDNLLTYLQSKGIRFGSDINAYTGFDETVYNINNIPTNDQALMDSVLLVLADWSGSILLEEDEINKERGVIEGEWRARNNADIRMYTAILPQIYEEYQYEQMPIGKMEVVKNFPPEDIRNYYKKWYRPDLQGIVIVGDFDADVMEQKVKDLFSQIPMPENAAERIYPNISDNDKPIYVTFQDPELRYSSVMVSFKYDRLPFEFRNTMENLIQEQVLSSLVGRMINNRLYEYSQKPECPYAQASVGVGTFYVSKQKGSFDVQVVAKNESNIVEAFDAAMKIVVQACRTGFNSSEVVRQRDEMLAGYEKLYNERDKTDSEARAREIIRNFTDNEPVPGIETEYEIMKQVLPMIPVEAYNELCSQLIHPNNQVIVVSQPQTPDLNVPQENEMIAQMNSILNADYTPYVDEEITEPLVAKLPKPGKIKSESRNAEFDTKEYVLSNGIKVITKATDFSNDEILMVAFKDAGLRSYPLSQAIDATQLEGFIDLANIGPFSTTKLEKYLAGKRVSLNYNVGYATNFFSGNSTVKDLPTLFELLYACFTDVTPNQETFDSNLNMMKTMLANQDKNPQFNFFKDLYTILYKDNPIQSVPTVETLDKLNYTQIYNLYQESVKNAGDYTFVIVGNIDEKNLKELLTKYVATLPVQKKSTPSQILNPLELVQGQVTKELNIASQSPQVFVYDCLSQYDLPFTVENQVKVNLLGDVVQMIFIETLREEMGGTYSPQVSSDLSPFHNYWTLEWMVITSEEMQKAICDRAMEEVNKLFANGADAEKFSRVKEAALKQLENSVRTNSYWLSNLRLNQQGFNVITNNRSAIENLTLEEFNNFIKTCYDGKNRVEVVGIAK